MIGAKWHHQASTVHVDWLNALVPNKQITNVVVCVQPSQCIGCTHSTQSGKYKTIFIKHAVLWTFVFEFFAWTCCCLNFVRKHNEYFFFRYFLYCSLDVCDPPFRSYIFRELTIVCIFVCIQVNILRVVKQCYNDYKVFCMIIWPRTFYMRNWCLNIWRLTYKCLYILFLVLW